jgi:hypothetical protein
MPIREPEAKPMRSALSVLVMAALTACATTGEATSYDPHLITLEEIEASHHANAYDIVQALRPRWLLTKTSMSIRTGPGSVRLYVDGVPQGGLRSIAKSIIREVRFYPPVEAQARWGAGHQQGAINVITRKVEAE